MAERDTFTTVADGDQLNEGYFNGIPRIVEIYEGTDFDSTTTTADEDIQSYELTAVASATNDYVKITMTGIAVNVGDGNIEVQIKAQIKETGGAYGDITAYVSPYDIRNNDSDAAVTSSIIFYSALTAGMKTNGYQIKLFSRSYRLTSGTATYTNIQVVVERMS